MEEDKDVDVAIALRMITKTLKQMSFEIAALREDVDKIMENIGACPKRITA